MLAFPRRWNQVGDFLDTQKEEASLPKQIYLEGKRKNWMAAGCYVLPAIVLFAFFPYVLTRKNVEERTADDFLFSALLVLFTLLAGFFQLLHIDISQRKRKYISLVFLFLFPFLNFLAVEGINQTDVLTEPIGIVRLLPNYLCYLMLYAFLHLLSRRVMMTCWTGSLITLIFGIANYYVTIFRNSPILPWDLRSAGTAAEVAGRYEFIVTDAMVFFVLLTIVMLSLLSKLQPDHQGDTAGWKIKERVVSGMLAVGLFVAILPMNLLSALGVEVWAWNQTVSSSSTGIVAGFMANMKYMMVEKPEDYSGETLDALQEQVQSKPAPAALGDPGKQPTIIAVMCESMSDMLTTNPELKLTRDNMPFIHSLQQNRQNVIAGTAYSSVFGGDTCNSEYEFLTGNSMAFFPIGSTPYQQYVTTPQNSLVGILQNYGYRTVAIHPAKATNWQRDQVYENFGFDAFTDYYGFHTEKVKERGYTNDESCYDEVIYEYENRDENQPLFTFMITIANHGGYEMEDYPAAVEIAAGRDDTTDYSEANQYLTSSLSSDKAFEKFIGYFEKEEEPVVILFFGDHWPYAGDAKQMEKLLGVEDYNDLSKEELMKRQQVPYLVWANYPLAQPENQDTSLNYLSVLLMRAAGLETTPYQNFLSDVSRTVPAITGVGMMDQAGQVYYPDEETPYDELLQGYTILQYNNVFDKDDSRTELFMP